MYILPHKILSRYIKTGRQYILGDSDPGYVEAARKRIANADPYVSNDKGNGVIQLSLFGDQP